MKSTHLLPLCFFATIFCLSANDLPGSPPAQVDITFRVDMRYQTVATEGVFFTSGVLSWEIVPMKQINDHVWEYTMKAPVSYEVLWKCLNGPGGWEELSVDDPCVIYGGINNPSRTYITGTHDVVLPTVCFGFCADCSLVETEEQHPSENIWVGPNPTVGNILLNYSLPQPTDLSICLLGPDGRIVLRKLLPAAHVGQLDLGQPATTSGTFYLVAQYGTRSSHFPIVVRTP